MCMCVFVYVCVCVFSTLYVCNTVYSPTNDVVISCLPVQLPERPPGDGKESSTHPPHSRDKTEFIPRIIVTEPTKSLRAKRQQISDPIKDDNEDYLEGYGIDYGAISSTTDLEKEGLSKYAEKDIAKKLKEKRKRIKKLNEQSKKPQKEKKKFSLFSRSKKKSKDKEQDEHILDYTELPSPSKSSVRFADILEEEIRKRESVISDVNSVGVNTSLGSDHTDTSILERGGATEGLQLPTEEESISEQVRRLQASVDQYNQEKQGNKKVEFFLNNHYCCVLHDCNYGDLFK